MLIFLRISRISEFQKECKVKAALSDVLMWRPSVVDSEGITCGLQRRGRYWSLQTIARMRRGESAACLFLALIGSSLECFKRAELVHLLLAGKESYNAGRWGGLLLVLRSYNTNFVIVLGVEEFSVAASKRQYRTWHSSDGCFTLASGHFLRPFQIPNHYT